MQAGSNLEKQHFWSNYASNITYVCTRSLNLYLLTIINFKVQSLRNAQ